VLGAEQEQRLDEAIAKGRAEVVRRAVISCAEGQRVSLADVGLLSYMTDYDVEITDGSTIADPIVQFAAIRALIRILPDEPRLVPVARVRLLKGLESDIEFVRAECAKTLGELGSAAKSALPQLKKLLDDESDMVRDAAAKAIKQIEQ